MLVPCYLVLVSLVFAAPGGSRNCYDYCKTRASDPMKDASLECDCADFIDTDESSMIILDDAGVYFVPAETHSFQGQFSSWPFFISNPVKFIPKTKNRINREFVTLKDPLNDPVPSQSTHVEIFKRTETISHTSIKEDLGKSPLYLDIEVQESADGDRAAARQYTLLEDFESTERDLVECLDFQVVHYTRKYGFDEKFKEFWIARNLDKYEHWSDLDIEENIQKLCAKLESIVQHSLQEIKQGLPKKVTDSRSHKIENKNQFSNSKNSTTLVTSLYINVTKPPGTYNNSMEGYTLPQNITEIYDTTYAPTEDWPFISVNSPPTLKEGHNTYEKQNSSLDAESDTTEITTNKALKKDNPKETTIETNQGIRTTARDSENDLDTMASEDVFYPYVPAVTEVKILDDAYHLDNNKSILNKPTTLIGTEESLERQSAVTNVNTLDGQGHTFNEKNTLSYDTSQTSITESYLQFREKYEEKDIQIPKIITKECQNNTTQTTIDGFEELPNNDFKDSTSHSENFVKGNGDVSELDITGRLYFISKRQLVPVRFVQTDTGVISLGVDGPALCDKLVLKTNKKSQLLTVLCDYVKNKNASTIAN